jgi:surfeit locus 1 family protein
VTSRQGKRFFFLALCAFGVVLFTGLGIWQLERRQWKLALIERVEARVDAKPVAVPPRSRWGSFDAREAEYRHVSARGILLHDRATLVDALTERGAGSWVLTPLRAANGVILINRGFVPPQWRSPGGRAEGTPNELVTITGLLRPSEPRGRFLRPNRPKEERWYSRDVAAIAEAQGLGEVAPFFIDADATANPSGYPVGGLTVVQFRNTHLVYALTWFGLAALSAVGLVLLLRPGQAPR